ncbi:hepatocyte growth factor-regulated tyrosine kinase substrate-like isoform X2 [Lineus longissimus]|uniref:hepatocyte growth factor-regulated tyrosine kinase substrate-like isoform X2 n=1 Tax=Lineus longissimus TaxID=88925 RepID=UPI002B4ED9FE
MFSSRSSAFDRALEKATSQLLLEPDWDAILTICDAIRQGDATPKYALAAIKKKLASENPHVCMFALQVLESAVKNCGSTIHGEVGSKEFMEFLKDQAKTRTDPVKPKILELIQVWSHAFRNDPSLRAVQDTFHLMKVEGYSFPALKESDAMFSAERAPEWKDGEVCHRCRVAFGMVQRKHHCRNCGEIFCAKCSAKTSIIPKYGIEKEVRVCDGCYGLLNKPSSAVKGKPSEDDLPSEYLSSSLSQQAQSPAPTQRSTKEQELQEEEELQLAIALSQSEAESKEKERDRMRQNYSLYTGSPERNTSPAPLTNSGSAPMLDTSDMDPELARYLNRNYWDKKSNEQSRNTATTSPTPSAPTASSEPKVVNKVQENYQNGETSEDSEQFLAALKGSIEIFVNRMKSNSQRGRSLNNDSSVQTLFRTINDMHPQLMKYMNEQEELRGHYESLQDKLAQLKDAREALNALREDYQEKKRLEEEAKERERQIQMAQKLEVMRVKKHEYLEFQRQLAIQRMAEQKHELQMRLEQQKQLTQMRQMQQYVYANPQQQQFIHPGQGFSPAGSLESSPVHRFQQQQQPGMYNPQQPMSMPVGQMGMGVQPPGGAAPTTGYSQQNYQQPTGQTASTTTTYQTPPPGGYQPPVSTYQGVQGPYPASSQPSMQQPPSGVQSGYMGQQQHMDYQNFNMQNMGNALPQQQPLPQQTGPGGPYNQQPQYMPQQGGVPGQYVQGGIPGQSLPQDGGHPQQQLVQSGSEQLICFD